MSFNPFKASDYISTMISTLLFSGLTILKNNGEVDLALAKSYEISDDKKMWVNEEAYLHNKWWKIEGKRIFESWLKRRKKMKDLNEIVNKIIEWKYFHLVCYLSIIILLLISLLILDLSPINLRCLSMIKRSCTLGFAGLVPSISLTNSISISYLFLMYIKYSLFV